MNELLATRIEKIEKGLRRIAASYSFDQHDADDIYGEMVVNILEHSSPEESNSRIYTRAHWAGQHHVSRLKTIGKYVVQDYDEASVEGADMNDPENRFDTIQSLKNESISVYAGNCTAASAEDIAISDEMAAALAKVIAQLPVQYREIVSMMYVGASQVEIAQKLSVTPSAINQRLKAVRTIFQSAGLSPSFWLISNVLYRAGPVTRACCLTFVQLSG
jgi:RNA polymerase sigma factor (sigma-70 family)